MDAPTIESQIQRVGTSLGKIKNIKTKVTNIRDGANDIEGEADALRTDIYRCALRDGGCLESGTENSSDEWARCRTRVRLGSVLN